MIKKRITVGLWIELSRTSLSECRGEGIVKWTRQLADGICKLPEVVELVVPAEPVCIPILTELLCNRGGKLPEKLIFIPTITHKSAREELRADTLASMNRSKLEIQKFGISSNPIGWLPHIFSRVRERRTVNRKISVVAELLWKVGLAITRIQVSKLRGMATKVAFEVVHKFDATTHRLAADVWITPNPLWRGLFAHPGMHVVAIPDLAYCELDLLESGESFDKEHNKLTLPLIEEADDIICFSQYFERTHLVPILSGTSKKVRVIQHASATESENRVEKVLTKPELGRRFRRYFNETRFNRYYCDFPLENCEYLFVSGKVRFYNNYPRVLQMYEYLLRRQRRNLKLIVTGNLSGDERLRSVLTSRGLVYDVIECTNIDEDFFEGLMAHAACLIIPTLFGSGFPFGFAEATRLRVPVAMCRIPVTEERLGPALCSPEYFDATNVDDFTRAVAFAIDNREEVIRRQLELSQSFPKSTWVDVARDFVQCTEQPRRTEQPRQR